MRITTMEEDYEMRLIMAHELYPHIVHLYEQILGQTISGETLEVQVFIGQDPELDECLIGALEQGFVALNYTKQMVGRAEAFISEIQQRMDTSMMLVQSCNYVAKSHESSRKRTRNEIAREIGCHSMKKPRLKERIAKEKVLILRQWLFEHTDHPYPTVEEKQRLATATGLSRQQINQWFVNARRRILKRMKQPLGDASWTVADYVRVLAE